MMRLPARIAIAVASVAALVLGFALPGSYVLAAGMLAFLLMPLLLRVPVGVPRSTSEGARIVTGFHSQHKMDVAARILGVFAWTAFAWTASLGRDGIVGGVFGILVGNGCALLALMGLIRRVLEPQNFVHDVILDRETLMINGPDGSHVVRHSDIRKVDVDGKRVEISSDRERFVVDVDGSTDVAARIATAILDARTKAGQGASDDRPGVRELHRPKGMGTREWLGRVDAVAAAARAQGAYRAGANIDEDELWTLFHDDALDADVRAAAARVLKSSPDEAVRVRVDTAAAEIADEIVRGRVRVAMNADAETAAAEMDELEMNELRRGAGV